MRIKRCSCGLKGCCIFKQGKASRARTRHADERRVCPRQSVENVRNSWANRRSNWFKIILADEPIASLDPMNAQIVMDTLKRINVEDKRMVIANLHTLDTARKYCDRVIGMRDGRIVFDGTPDQLSTGVAREIYGADASFDEAATSTAIPTDTAADVKFASAMLA
jgi:ABC-type hemin transport system ATPase subunit